jgi:NAD+ synthase (glutamine-hydrolysing)
MTSRFFSLHRQGFVRVAACTPRIAVGDPARNAVETLELLREGAARGVDLMLFPELGLSAYAIDDLFLQDALLDGVERAIGELVQASRELPCVFAVGAPVRYNHRLFNCAVVIARGRIVGVTPKSFLPNYREYYEHRWFAPGVGITGREVTLAGQTAPFGTDLLFASTGLADFVFHVEICEDVWAPAPPSIAGALAGAAILCNLSASNVVIGKAAERAALCISQSMRCQAAYVYSAAGPGESTTDLAWDGQATIHELGVELARTERFPANRQMAVADVDVQRIRLERLRTPTFHAAAAAAGHPETSFRRVRFEHAVSDRNVGLVRPMDRFPFVPDDPAKLDLDCYEAFNIQIQGLRKRLEVHQRRAHRDRRFRRPRLDPRADRRGAHVRHARPAALEHPRVHDARVRDLGQDQGQRLGADEGPRRDRGGDRHQARGAADARGSSAIRSRAERRSTTSRSRTCRRDCARTTCSVSPTSGAPSCSAPATCPSSRSGGARTAWAIT